MCTAAQQEPFDFVLAWERASQPETKFYCLLHKTDSISSSEIHQSHKHDTWISTSNIVVTLESSKGYDTDSLDAIVQTESLFWWANKLPQTHLNSLKQSVLLMIDDL